MIQRYDRATNSQIPRESPLQPSPNVKPTTEPSLHKMSSSLTLTIQDSTSMKLIFIHPTRLGISSRASCWFRHDNLHSSQCKYQRKAKNVIYQKE
jgi:hypothetical protein